ncbi:hypothetical protein POM88_018037 [Heracleum sosnowskyi]|uniref:Uncharacterized protein n=1 Tax=Heracleum sosnowskyi TaxID=360622 RepID=A0AAD8GM83_9APIA|nr:hypothetical protein POM88_054714 [Heracleum sosnowskyi]KAK1389859.1 hypothetical protein POM88_018037 [Heracleum sosnowskyi]
MEYYSSSKSLSTEDCSTTESESGWTNYIGDEVDDGAESDDSLTSDARSSSPPPPPRRFHRYNQHSDDDHVQDKLRVEFTSSVSKKMKLFQKQMVSAEKSMKQPCNNVTNINKQANHDDDLEEEDNDNDDDEQLMKYQQSYRTTTACSTTDTLNYSFYRAQNP